ncbi:MAG: hypothetical protein N2515_04945 [Deltaproteobacteria bacterium]|nr:hypothetical protein [Deltaproteobacteria bacterium]
MKDSLFPIIIEEAEMFARSFFSSCSVLALTCLAIGPAEAQGKRFYLTAVEVEGVEEPPWLESDLIAAANRCSTRHLPMGERAIDITVGQQGAVLSIEIQSDDVSPTPAEGRFANCLKEWLKRRVFPAPRSTPASLLIRIERSQTIPEHLRPGGVGVRRGPRQRNAPSIQRSSTLDQSVVREIFSQNASQVEACARNHLPRTPHTLQLELRIGLTPDGSVSEVNIQPQFNQAGSEPFLECLREHIRKWRFPGQGQPAAVQYTLRLATDSPSTPPAQPTQSPQ